MFTFRSVEEKLDQILFRLDESVQVKFLLSSNFVLFLQQRLATWVCFNFVPTRRVCQE